VRLFVGRAPQPPREHATRDVVRVALGLAVARWSADLIRDASAEMGAMAKLRGRMAKFRLAALCVAPLRAACALVGADPVLVGAALRDHLVKSLDDTLAATPDHAHVPHRIIALVEQTWPEFLHTFADEIIGGHHV
jgi:hypothetical protein